MQTQIYLLIYLLTYLLIFEISNNNDWRATACNPSICK